MTWDSSRGKQAKRFGFDSEKLLVVGGCVESGESLFEALCCRFCFVALKYVSTAL
jgi:hypothetical protein